MAEKQLVVDLALKNSGFDKQLKSITGEMKLLESNFKKAEAGSKGFSNSLEGQKAKLNLLEGQYGLLQKKINVYNQQLEKARETLNRSTVGYTKAEEKLKGLKEELVKAENEFGKSSKEVKELKEKIKDAEKAFETKANAVVNANNKLLTIQSTINKTEAEAGKLQSEINELGQEIKEIGDKVEEASDGFDEMSDNMKDATKEAEESGARLSLIGQGLQNVGDKASEAGKAMLGVVGDLTKAGAEYSAEVAGTDFLMKNLDKTVQEAITSNSKLSKEIGLTEKQYKDSAVSIATYYKNMGFTAEESVNLSSKTMTLVADLAAVTDMPFDDAMGRFKSGLMGNYEALDAFGINLSASTLENSEFVKSLGKSWNKLSDNEKMMAAYNEIVRQGSSANGLAAQEAEQFGMKSKYLKERLDEVKGTIGEKLLPVLEPLIEKIVNVVEKVTEWIEVHPELTKYILIIAGGFGALLAIIGPIISFIGTLIIAFGALNVAMLPLTGTILLVIAAIAALIAIVVLVIAKWDEIKQCWANFCDWAIQKWTEFKEWMSQCWDGIKQKCSELAQVMVDWIKQKWTDFVNWITGWGERITSSVSNAWNYVKTTATNLAQSTVDWIKNKWNSFVDWLFGWGSRIQSSVSNIWTNIKNTCSNLAQGVVDGVRNAFSRVYDFITSPFKRAWDYISGIGSKIGGIISKINPFNWFSLENESDLTPVLEGNVSPLSNIAKSGQYYTISNNDRSSMMTDFIRATNNLPNVNSTSDINLGIDFSKFGSIIAQAIVSSLQNVTLNAEITTKLNGREITNQLTSSVIRSIDKGIQKRRF
ncbi:hypothetical protein ACV3TP_02870 [Clostridium perfringens]